MAAAVDTNYLSSYTSVPEPTIQSLLSEPTPAELASFLRNLIEKAQEHEKLKSDHVRLEVELENAIRSSDVKDRQQQLKANTAVQEAQVLRTRLEDEEKSKASLQVQLENLQTSSVSSSSETQALQSQISRLEKSHRDSLSLLESKSTAHDRLSQELTAQHQKYVDVRRDLAAAEERKQALENELSDSKFKESQIQTEVARVKRSNEWLDSELKTKNEEHTKFRKEKNSRIAELQRANEDCTQSVESLQRTETTLRKRLEDKDQKLDESFLKIQQLEEEAARQEENFRIGRDSVQRLADLQKQSADTARRRVQELEDEKAQLKDDAADEIANVQSELESERQERETVERKVEELEADVERLETELQLSHNADRPSTPRPRAGGRSIPNTPGRAATPSAFSPGSTRSRAGISFTQLFAEYNGLKVELEQEQRAHSALRQTFDEMLRELQDKEPELQQTQEERDHYEAEVNQLSSLLETARQDRDAARKDYRKLQLHAESCERKARNLEQQLRDLSAQVKTLVVEVQIREQGGQLDVAQREQLHQAARGELDLEALAGMSDTAQWISQNLITFKNVFELQEKNMELTKVVRELGENGEAEEARRREDSYRKDQVELESLRDRVDRYKDEVKMLVTQSQSYIRERDMFRRMLTHRGQLPPDADLDSLFGNSVNGNGVPQTPRQGRSTNGADQSPHSKDLADHVKLLKELQSHFDAYRQESATDYNAAKAQIEQLNKEKNQLQSDVIRTNSQLNLAQERYQMLQSNYELLRNEHNEIQKRSNTLHEAAARQDIRTQQVAEDLVEAQSLAEGLRNENANLKAEKDMWKRIETRLAEDNRSLVEERGRLNKLLADTQSLANERELSESESRRRFQTQVDALEAEVQSTRRKLDEELESSKSASLRREYEQEQNKTRIDDLVKSLSIAKEELVGAKATRDQLQSRVEEMKIELRSAEERTQTLQLRPISVADVSTHQVDGESLSDTLTREQQLSMDIIDLKKELDLSKADLDNARVQVEQYRAISQSAEEELNNINEAHDQYRDDADKVLAEKDAKIRDLEQRLEDTSTELAAINTQFAELKASTAESTTRLDQQRASFESEISQIKDECERYRETADFHLQDKQAQAEVAQQAQQSYDNELLKHAEATKALKKVRDELNEIKLEVSTSKADAEAARMLLSQNKDSWNSTKEQYEKELADMKVRRDDVDAQNKILHAQLESVSAQITALQQRHSSPTPGHTPTADADNGLHNLQEVIKYLRREKEIVDVQFELSTQETRRLKQQLDYSQTQLDEARFLLDQERQRRADTESNATSHKQLMDTLNELNVFRESSVTLRNEARQAQAQVTEKSKQIEELLVQIEPLRVSLRELQEEHEVTKGRLKLAEDDQNYWKQRTQSIISKYDRIDPAELEGLREQITKLESERDEVSINAKNLQERIDKFSDELKEGQESARKDLREKLGVQFKERSKQLSQQINAGKAEAQALRTQLESTQAELETTRIARDEAVKNASAQPAKAQDGGEDGEIDETPGSGSRANDSTSQADSNELLAARNEAESLQRKVKELEERVNELQGLLDQSQQALTLAQSKATDTASAEQLEKLKRDLAAAQSELENLRSSGASTDQQTSTTAPNDLNAAELEHRTQAIRAELENASSERVKQVESNADQRISSMRNQLQTKLNEGKAAYREQLRKEQEEVVKKLEQELEELKRAPIQSSSENSQPPNGTTVIAAPPTENAFNADSTIKVKTESTASPDQWTANQVQAFIQGNTHVKAIVARNIKARIEQETAKLKESTEKAIEARLQEERSTAEKATNNKLEEFRQQAEKATTEKLEEARQKAEIAKTNAIAMEGKRISVKMSMSENKIRAANAKLEVVEKAATETPQQPVVEVWNIAKNTKAPLAPPPVQTPSGQASLPPKPITTTAQSPAVSAPSPSQTKPPQAGIPAAQTTAARTQQAAPKPVEPGSQNNNVAAADAQPAAESTNSSQNPTTEEKLVGGAGATAGRGQATQGSGIPRGGASIRGAAGRGRGGSANAGGDSTQLPQPPHSGIPRGGSNNNRGAGRGRGGQGQQGRQFVPGSKRPREDSSGNAGDVGSKRPRGGQGSG